MRKSLSTGRQGGTMFLRKMLIIIAAVLFTLPVTSCGSTSGQIEDTFHDAPSSPQENDSPSLQSPVEDTTTDQKPVQDIAPGEPSPPPHKFKYAILSRAVSTFYDDQEAQVVQAVLTVSFDENDRIEKTEHKLTGLGPSVFSVNYSYSPNGKLQTADFFGASFYQMSFVFDSVDLPSEFAWEVTGSLYTKRQYNYNEGPGKDQFTRLASFYFKEDGAPDPHFTEKTIFEPNFLPVSFEYCSDGSCTLTEYKFQDGGLSSLRTSNTAGVLLCDIVYNENEWADDATVDVYEKGFLKSRIFVKATKWDNGGNVLQEEVQKCTLGACSKYAERSFEYYYTDSEEPLLALPIVLKTTLLTPSEGTLLYANAPQALFGKMGISLY